MGHVLKRNSTNAWHEYSVSVEGLQEFPVDVCGLCANSGILNTRGNVRATDMKVGVEAFCICPNGRAKKKKSSGKRWGNSSVINQDPDGQPNADELGWEGS